MSRGTILSLFLCLAAGTAVAAPHSGKITGLVVDSSGTPQMGATVLISSDQLLNSAPFELLTNDRGRFSSLTLPVGVYSVKVTLAGFLPAVEQDIQVSDQHTTLLEIVLGSVFSSLEKLRRAPDQQVSSDDWSWVLRTSAATRPVLRWQDGDVVLGGGANPFEGPHQDQLHARLELTSGSDHPGSVSTLADTPGTAFAYDYGLDGLGNLLMAGQFSYDAGSQSSSFVAQWLPSGDSAPGPVTTLLIRDSQLGAAGPAFRGLRLSHDSSFQLGERVSIRYGADFLMAGLQSTTSSLRPRAEMAVRIAPTWQASMIIATNAWQDSAGAPGDLQSTINQLDAFPTLLLRAGRPVLEDGMHEEVAVEHDLGRKSSLTAAFFSDRSSNTAVFGHGNISGPDFLPDYYSNVFAYDAGSMNSLGARLVYQRKIATNVDMTVIYSYAGALAPNGDTDQGALRNQLATQYRSSAAARFAATIPRSGTKFVSSYKWINGPAVSQQDAYGQSTYHVDPYLSLEIHQRLPRFIPGHAEILADCGNLLAQGYVIVSTTSDGQIVLVPTYRFFRGGLSFQF
ncbi:MAG: carboxypeptidase-like regulatory domain-containing protein [Candidatus Acidiferrales bacterium]